MTKEEKRAYDRAHLAQIKADPVLYANYLERKRAEHAARVASPEYKAKRKAQNAAQYLKEKSDPIRLERRRASARKAARRAYGFAAPHGETRGGRCDICNIDHETLCHDHDHDTGASRGWLCERCNIGIGFLQDSVDNLEHAARYLRMYKRPALRCA